jgi:hypothetical protein
MELDSILDISGDYSYDSRKKPRKDNKAYDFYVSGMGLIGGSDLLLNKYGYVKEQ